MNNQIKVERITLSQFKDFTSLYTFCVFRDNPSIHQAYFYGNNVVLGALGPEGNVIAAFGIIEKYPGVGELWLLSTDDMNKNPIWMLKNFRNLISEHLGKHYHRLEAIVDANQKMLCKFTDKLGLQFEGIMRKHSITKVDHALYSKIS